MKNKTEFFDQLRIFIETLLEPFLFGSSRKIIRMSIWEVTMTKSPQQVCVKNVYWE